MKPKSEVFIEPTLEISWQQIAVRGWPARKRWGFWKQQCEGNARAAWRNLREQWAERDRQQKDEKKAPRGGLVD